MTPAARHGGLNDIQPPVPRSTCARTLLLPMTHLFADDLAASAGTLRTAQRWIERWRRAGFPRVERVQRTDARGRAIGGVQWAVRAGDYDDLVSGRVREQVVPAEPQAA